MKTVSELPKPKDRGQWVDKSAVFACSLRNLRERHQLTLRDVAKYSGVSVATIARIEWGAECNLSQALKLAHFFETTVEKIWGPSAGEPQP